MAASRFLWRIDPLSHNYCDPLFKSNRAALHFNLPSNPSLKLIRSHNSSNSFHSTASSAAAAAPYRQRQSPIIVNVSSQNSSENGTQSNRFSINKIRSKHAQLLQHFSLRMALEIITFIWRIPGFIARFFKEEEKFLDEVEEDITKTADVIKVGAKLVEEVAEGLEEVAEGIEKVAKTIDKDAKEVDDIMDKVKEKTKAAHDEIEEVVGSLQGSIQDMEKDVTKVQIKVKGSKELNTPKEESTNTPTTIETPTSQEETTNHGTKNTNQIHDLLLVRRSPIRLFSFFDALKWLLTHVHLETLSCLMTLSKFFFGPMLMIFFYLGIGAMTKMPLVSYAF